MEVRKTLSHSVVDFIPKHAQLLIDIVSNINQFVSFFMTFCNIRSDDLNFHREEKYIFNSEK
jgi:hypothetical protein